MGWIIFIAVVAVVLGVVAWRDRRHHGRIDQGRVAQGITDHWIRDATMSPKFKRPGDQ